MNKQNVFDDFIGAAEWLIREGYTDKEHIAIVAGRMADCSSVPA